ncbi:hypothetical protein Acy02nite_82180 [Actinoplanes cyaneus]|uniref:Deoxyribonuclease NucA/NucB domain-containing protein n=1 Tax=Actinoplanes cyaneus TaxID=52696 RepID=A0A919ITS4_9ACTN|nr:hypothetical protein [Actinoplanes cyaneus]GID70337.1 hypothetical protein Acy02nite_82180 [Actinoplanes cyaneus]
MVLTHHSGATAAAQKRVKAPHPYAGSHKRRAAPRGLAAASRLSTTSEQSYGSGADAVTLAADEPFGLDECRDQYYDHTDGVEDTWWIKNHFLACAIDEWSVDTLQKIDGKWQTVGQIFFRVTGVVEGSKGTRQLVHHYEFDHWDEWGLADWAASLDFDADCAFATGARCPDVNQHGRRDTVLDFRHTGKTDLTVDLNNNTVGTGPDKLIYYEFTPELFLTAYPTEPEIVLSTLDVRCDWATYEHNGGCIFNNVRAHWEGLSLSNPDVDEAAKHVNDAFTDISRTKPGVPGTYVPGNFNSNDKLQRGAALTRARDADFKKANYNASVKACKAAYGSGYTDGATKDCDEYPMQSTHQGTATVNLEVNPRSFSVRPIDKYDNRRAGARLGVWYQDDHILEGDAFWINIKP